MLKGPAEKTTYIYYTISNSYYNCIIINLTVCKHSFLTIVFTDITVASKSFS